MSVSYCLLRADAIWTANQPHRLTSDVSAAPGSAFEACGTRAVACEHDTLRVRAEVRVRGQTAVAVVQLAQAAAIWADLPKHAH